MRSLHAKDWDFEGEKCLVVASAPWGMTAPSFNLKKPSSKIKWEDKEIAMTAFFLSKAPPSSEDALPDCEDKSLPVITGIAAAFPLIGSSSQTGDPPQLWSPAKRIITFMGLVCLVCTLFVIGIVIFAFFLSKHTNTPNTLDTLYTVPESHSRKSIEVIHPYIVNRQIEALQAFWSDFATKVSSNTSRTPTNCTWFRGIANKVNPGCRNVEHFGYRDRNPCVAIVLKAPSWWSPSPYRIGQFPEGVPEFVERHFDPDLVLVTCHSDTPNMTINYSPYQGFPVKYFAPTEKNDCPVFVMLRFSSLPRNRKTKVTCFLWTSNLKMNDQFPVPGYISFYIQS